MINSNNYKECPSVNDFKYDKWYTKIYSELEETLFDDNDIDEEISKLDDIDDYYYDDEYEWSLFTVPYYSYKLECEEDLFTWT